MLVDDGEFVRRDAGAVIDDRDHNVVTVVDSWYSEKGRDMDVYAPAGDPLVLVAGCPDELEDTREAVTASPTGDPAPGLGD